MEEYRFSYPAASEKGKFYISKFRDDKRVRIGEDIITMGYDL